MSDTKRAEEALLSALLNNPEVWVRYIDRLDYTLFSNKLFQRIVFAAHSITEDGRTITEHAILTMLTRANVVTDQAMFMEECSRLRNLGESKDNISEHIDFIRCERTKELAKGQLSNIGNKISSSTSEAEIVNHVSNVVDVLRAGTAESTTTSLGHGLIDKYRTGRPAVEGYPMGFPTLDDSYKGLGGLVPGNVTCFLANSGVGKSSLLSVLTAKLAYQQGLKVLHINTEMNEDEIFVKIVANLSGVRIKDIESGEAIASISYKKKLEDVFTQVSKTNDCKFLYMSFVKYEEMFNIMLKHIQVYGTEVIVLDHIKPESDSDADNWYKTLSRFADRLKNNIAQKHQVAVVTAAQSKRGSSGGSTIGEELTLRSMGDSYGIVRHLDNIIALEPLSEAKAAACGQPNANLSLHVLKGRFGGLDARVLLYFDLSRMKVMEL